ncbi:MAG: hypothetical protein R2736_17785 [Solirubrobacterales bacterium]
MVLGGAIQKTNAMTMAVAANGATVGTIGTEPRRYKMKEWRIRAPTTSIANSASHASEEP